MSSFLLKVFDEKRWAERFINYGEMLFSRPSIFHKKNDARKDIKDSLTCETVVGKVKSTDKEVLFGRVSGKAFGIKIDKLKELFGKHITNNPMQFEMEYIPDIFIYSMVGISERTQDLEKTLEEIKKFGSYIVVITNISVFLKKLNDYIKEIGWGAVKYTNNPSNVFEKTLEYNKEQEIRFITQIKSKDDKKIFHIGSIKDIGYLITIKDLWKLKGLIKS